MRELRIEVLGGTALRLVGPAGEVLGRRELAVGEIDALVDEVTADYEAYAPRLLSIGNRLYAWLDGSGQRWLTRARESLRGEALCVRLDVGHRLRHLPWELASVEGAHLVADVANPFYPLREVDKRGSEHQVANRPLRALFMASSPVGVSPLLNFEAEEARILAAAGAGGVDLVVEERGSLGSLAESLKRHGPGHFDVVHLSGHANVTRDLGPHVLLENDTGGLDRCSADRLIAAVEGHWPRVLFVSGCRTGQSPERGVSPSFAEQLVRAGAPCVVGWGQPVGDVAATAVAAALYARLGNGEDPATAVARARWEALDQGFGHWHLLRAYVDGSALVPLVTPPATPGRPRIQLRPAHREFLDADQRSPVSAADRFVGRRRVLQRCLRSLATLDQSAPDYAEGVVLHGMGGLGKSSLAARLCERLRTHRRLVWVGTFDEGELVRLLNAKLDAAATGLLNQPHLPLRDRLCDVLGHLDAAGAPPLLFVLDDFEHNVEGHDDGHPRLVGPGGSALLTTAALDVLGALAWAIRETASPSRVIVTCRYVIAGPPAPVRLAHVGLEAMAGAELTKKTAQLARLADPATDADLRARAMALADGNPRLLELLDKAMDLTGMDTGTVLAALGQVSADFRERVLVDALLDAQSDGTRRVLACLAVCRLGVDAATVSAIANTDATAALAAAMAAGLVESGPDPATSTARYRVLTLVANLVAEAITDDERAAATDRAATHLYETWWATGKGLVEPRALELLRLCRAAEHSAHAVGIATAMTAAWQRQGRYAEAVALREQVVADRERHLGPDHPDTVVARANLAISYWSAGRTADALALREQVVADRERHLGPDHPDTVAARANLAISYWSAGRTADALALREQVVADSERLLGPDHPDTVAARANLAISYWSAGRTADALALREQVVADRKRLLGPDHPDTLSARANLAISYSSAGRTADALALREQVVADSERLLGPEHPNALSARANLATSYSSAGRTALALALQEQVVADRERLLGPDHPDTVMARANLAAFYRLAGRTAEALALQERVVADRKRLLGPDHPDTVAARANLATSYSSAGRTADALALREQVVADRKRLLGPDHPDTLSARANLAISYSSAGRTADALALREQVVVDSERLLGPDHPDTVAARTNLAASYWSAGRTADALAIDEQVVADRGRLLGPDHPDTVSARANLATSYWSAGRRADALALREQVVADSERLLGPSHPETVKARANLAHSYWSAGRTADAIALQEQVVADRERLLGPDHPDTVAARANLANSYWSAGRTADALALREQVVADRERLLGPDHPDTVMARANLAVSYSSAGRTADALALQERVVADRERLLGPDHPDTVAARANLAISYSSAGRTADALTLREQVVADCERLLGPDHPDTVGARSNLALSYWTAGRTADALALREQVMADSERLLGPDHPETVKSRANLAHSYWSAGRTADALTLREQVVADCERLLGPDHPETVKARAKLATSYWSAGRRADALALQERVVADSERLLGPDHPETAAIREALKTWRNAEE